MKRLLVLFAVAVAAAFASIGCSSARHNLAEIYDLESGTPYPILFDTDTEAPGTFVVTDTSDTDVLHLVFVTPKRTENRDRLYNPHRTTPVKVKRSLIDATTRPAEEPSTITLFVDDGSSIDDSLQRNLNKHLEKVSLSLSPTERQQLGV